MQEYEPFTAQEPTQESSKRSRLDCFVKSQIIVNSVSKTNRFIVSQKTTIAYIW